MSKISNRDSFLTEGQWCDLWASMSAPVMNLTIEEESRGMNVSMLRSMLDVGFFDLNGIQGQLGFADSQDPRPLDKIVAERKLELWADRMTAFCSFLDQGTFVEQPSASNEGETIQIARIKASKAFKEWFADAAVEMVLQCKKAIALSTSPYDRLPIDDVLSHWFACACALDVASACAPISELVSKDLEPLVKLQKLGEALTEVLSRGEVDRDSNTGVTPLFVAMVFSSNECLDFFEAQGLTEENYLAIVCDDPEDLGDLGHEEEDEDELDFESDNIPFRMFDLQDQFLENRFYVPCDDRTFRRMLSAIVQSGGLADLWTPAMIALDEDHERVPAYFDAGVYFLDPVAAMDDICLGGFTQILEALNPDRHPGIQLQWNHLDNNLLEHMAQHHEIQRNQTPESWVAHAQRLHEALADDQSSVIHDILMETRPLEQTAVAFVKQAFKHSGLAAVQRQVTPNLINIIVKKDMTALMFALLDTGAIKNEVPLVASPLDLAKATNGPMAAAMEAWAEKQKPGFGGLQ